MINFRHRFCLVFTLSLLVGSVAVAQSGIMADGHPYRYTVQKGDTLWDIAARFLREPWRWPEIWHVNPQVRNPHWIYPGDVLELVYVDGKPQLRLRDGKLRLSPQVRATPWDGRIPTVPLDVIAPFLSRPYVLEEGQFELAPYVVDFADEHVVGAAGQRVYVRAIESDSLEKFDVIRRGGPLFDADTREPLGHYASYVGSAELQTAGDPATLLLARTEKETVIGDRLIPARQDQPIEDFFPKPPDREINGSIIGVLNGVSQIGQLDVVILDRGADDGLTPGTVLQVDRRGETIRDVVADDPRERVTLPDEKAGLLMVFRTFQRVSFGIVLEATRAMNVMDRFRNP
jgi:hypothetical protein